MIKQIFLAIVIFILICALSVGMILKAEKPQRQQPTASSYKVAAISVTQTTIQPWVTGYGEVTPDKTWTAIAQVSGKITEISKNLKNGAVVQEGELLIQIDKQEYELAIQTAEANIKKIEAAILEKKTTRENLNRTKELLKELLALNEKNLERKQALLSSNVASHAELDSERMTVLNQKNSIASTDSQLNLIPAQIASLEADLLSAQIALKKAKLNLSYTTIIAPFRGRIDAVKAEKDQFAPTGTSLFQIDSMDRAEIDVPLSMEQLVLLNGTSKINQKDKAPREKRKDNSILVTVDEDSIPWNAEFVRIGAEVDPMTRMVSIIVGVTNPYNAMEHGSTPLSKGTFCTVRFQGRARNALVIPRLAIHSNVVYIATKENTLEMRPVKTQYTFGQYAVISDDSIQENETLIISDVVPAIAGMKIEPVLSTSDSYYETLKQGYGAKEGTVND